MEKELEIQAVIGFKGKNLLFIYVFSLINEKEFYELNEKLYIYAKKLKKIENKKSNDVFFK